MLIGYNFERSVNYATQYLFVGTEENKFLSPENLFRGRD